MESAETWLVGDGIQPRRESDWTRLLSLHERRGDRSTIFVVTTFSRFVPIEEILTRSNDIYRKVEADWAKASLKHVAVAPIKDEQAEFTSIHISRAKGVLALWISPLHQLDERTEAVQDVSLLVPNLCLNLLQSGVVSIETIASSLRSEFGTLAMAALDEQMQQSWQAVLSLADENNQAETPSQDDVSEVFMSVRHLQSRLRMFAAEYRNTDDEQNASFCQERLAELSSAIQALGVSVSLADTRRERILASAKEKQTRRLTEVALIVAFPALYLAGLQVVGTPAGFSICQKMALALSGSIIAALIGYLISTAITPDRAVK